MFVKATFSQHHQRIFRVVIIRVQLEWFSRCRRERGGDVTGLLPRINSNIIINNMFVKSLGPKHVGYSFV